MLPELQHEHYLRAAPGCSVRPTVRTAEDVELLVTSALMADQLPPPSATALVLSALGRTRFSVDWPAVARATKTIF